MTKIKRSTVQAARPLCQTSLRQTAGLLILFVLLAGPLFIGCSHTPATASALQKVDPSPSTASPDGQTYILVGAGDIASCKDPEGAQATARLLEQIPGTIFAAGDLAYERGTAGEFQKCYGTTWGEFKARTKPTPGNHEYADPTASAYF